MDYSFTSFFTQCGWILLAIAVIWLLSRWLKIKTTWFSAPDPRKSALVALLVVLIWGGMTYGLLALLPGEPEPEIINLENYDPMNAFSHIFIYAIMLIPLLIIRAYMKEPWSSLGIHKDNLWRSLLISGVICVAMVVQAIQVSEQTAHPVGPMFWGFVQYAAVGLGEEIAFRGYVQSRLISWVGKAPGVIATAVLFSFLHFPHRIFQLNIGIEEALLDCLFLIPISILLAILYLRTGNIAAPALLHTFANWTELI